MTAMKDAFETASKKSGKDKKAKKVKTAYGEVDLQGSAPKKSKKVAAETAVEVGEEKAAEIWNANCVDGEKIERMRVTIERVADEPKAKTEKKLFPESPAFGLLVGSVALMAGGAVLAVIDTIGGFPSRRLLDSHPERPYPRGYGLFFLLRLESLCLGGYRSHRPRRTGALATSARSL